jgi:putative ATP-binding cassette transporter
MMQLVLDELPDSALVSIGHRPGLEAFHTRTLKLVRAEGGARLALPKRTAKDRQWSRPLPRAERRRLRVNRASASAPPVRTA